MARVEGAIWNRWSIFLMGGWAPHTIQLYGATDSLDVENYTSFFLDDISLIHTSCGSLPVYVHCSRIFAQF
jgi:hypothetical protein